MSHPLGGIRGAGAGDAAARQGAGALRCRMMGSMDDGMRAGLRALVQRAEWPAPAAGRNNAEACARELREVGRELAGRVAHGEDRDTWAHRATTELAAHCRRANPAWTADDVAELARLRAAALIALAPPPGSPDPTIRQEELSSEEPVRTRAALPGGRRTAVIGLAAVGVAALVGIVVAVTGGGHGGAVGLLPTAAASQAPVGLASTVASPPVLGTGPTGATGVAGASASASSTVSPTSESAPAGRIARVTAIAMTATPASGYPEVQIFGIVTASGTGNVSYTVTVAGPSGAPQVSTEDESGQISYALSQTIYLQPWCGQKSVTVTVSSGAVTRSAVVPVAGC